MSFCFIFVTKQIFLCAASFNCASSFSADEFCEKIDSENCPRSTRATREQKAVATEWQSTDEYIKIMLEEVIANMDLVISMSLTALTLLIFTLGYYCIGKAKREGPLVAKVRKSRLSGWLEADRAVISDERARTALNGLSQRERDIER